MTTNKYKYFYLKRHCFVELGKNGAALYNLYNGEIYSIDLTIGRILNKCENEKCSLSIALKQYNKKRQEDIIKYLKELNDLNLGDFYEKQIIIEKLKPFITNKQLTELGKPPKLIKLWLQIENNCNLNCLHCNIDKNTISRCSCHRNIHEKNERKPLHMSDWKLVLDNAALLKCTELEIVGGEPLLNKDILFSLLEYARRKFIPSIKVQSNGLIMNKEIINFFKKNEIVWRTSLFSYRSDVHDEITNIEDSWKNLIDNLKYAGEKKLKLQIIIEIMKINQNDISDTIKFLHNIGIENISFSYVLSNIHRIWPKKLEDTIIKTKNNIPGVSKDVFFRNRMGHPCWNGKLAITINGNILPCIMAYDEVIGNVKEVQLKDLIRDKKIKNWWQLTKDKIEICNKCEFRYACFDCRVRESADKTLYGKNKFCQIY